MKKRSLIASLIAFVVLVVGLAVSAYLVQQRQEIRERAAPEMAEAPTVTKKVFLLIFNPTMENRAPVINVNYPEGKQLKLSVIYGWNDPEQLTSQFIETIRETSNNLVNYEVALKQEIDGYPPKTDGFMYTNEDYNQCVASRGSNCHNPDGADYNNILASVCGKVNSGEIDELWMWGGPWFGYWESNLAGPAAFFYNSWPTWGTNCEKLLPIMGFNYERGLAEALESYGHRLESTIRHIYGFSSWAANENHPWNKFTLLDIDRPVRGGCGNAHLAVNASSNTGYDRTNQRTVKSSCEDFLNYPNLTGSFTDVNCNTWGCSTLGYFRWWYGHLPRASGQTDGILNNWWAYIVNPTLASTSQYSPSPSPTPPAPTPTPITSSSPIPGTPTPSPSTPPLGELSNLEIRLRLQGIDANSTVTQDPKILITLKKEMPTAPSDRPFRIQEIQRVLEGTEVQFTDNTTPEQAKNIIENRIASIEAVSNQPILTQQSTELPKLREALARVNLYFPTFSLTPNFTFENGVFTTQFQIFSPGISYSVYAKTPKHLRSQLTTRTIFTGESIVLSENNRPPLLSGDITSDGDSANKIDIFDYNLMVSHFGPRMPEGGSPADLDLDSDVDIFDYNLLLSNFGKTDSQDPNSPSPSPSPTPSQQTQKPIYLYPSYETNPNVRINQTHIISLLFVPKDINTPIKTEWVSNMEKIDIKIKEFFEKQFENNIEITYEVITEPVGGNKNLEEYDAYDLAQEARNKTNNLTESGKYNVWMIYLVRDLEYKKNVRGGNLGGIVSLQAATQAEFWLDNEALNSKSQYGLRGSAHEFGHVLGIPHPWELPANTNNDPNFGNVPGDLMAFGGSLDFDNLYIRDDVKKAMGL